MSIEDIKCFCEGPASLSRYRRVGGWLAEKSPYFLQRLARHDDLMCYNSSLLQALE
jgi:hypothetical protein